MRFAETNPIFQQIADMLCDGVLKGRYAPGERIPSVRDMAVSIEVNPNTVQRAYTLLQDRGIIENQRGLGYSVADGAVERAREHNRARLEAEVVPRLIEYMETLDMDAGQMCAMLEKARKVAERQRSSKGMQT